MFVFTHLFLLITVNPKFPTDLSDYSAWKHPIVLHLIVTIFCSSLVKPSDAKTCRRTLTSSAASLNFSYV